MSVSVRSMLVEGPVQGPPRGPPRGPYTYANTPRALYNNSKLKKDPPCGPGTLHDARIVRGSNAARALAAAGDGVLSGAARAAETRRRALARRRAPRPGTPPPAPGRRHHPLQTDLYLEELFDKGVEMSVGVQTDLFVDRPATPVYVPAKTGADAATQIYPGELFDFDVEVAPLLEALVGGTAAQALGEVAREEELAALRQHQRRFRELRDAERAERERLLRQEKRLATEAGARAAAARLAADAALEARARAAAALLVQGYAAELLPAALAGLRAHGLLAERARAAAAADLLPWLSREVAAELRLLLTSRDLVSALVREVVLARADLLGRDAAYLTPPDTDTPQDSAGEEESPNEDEEK